jgi:hypothetical protein
MQIPVHELNNKQCVLTARQGPEALLSSGVPYRQLDPLATELHYLGLEVDADGGYQVFKPSCRES